MKVVLVSGGNASGSGKGSLASNVGVLLQAAGLCVSMCKIEPYLNCDAGTMNPSSHGECRVLDDGHEVDLDFGTYERALGIRLTHAHNITCGKLYRAVIEKERLGEYLGSTVQMVPHVSDALETCLKRVSHIPVDPKRPNVEPDVLIIELGGTVGDIESVLPLETLRRMRYRMGSGNFCHMHLVLVPGLGPLEEPKTKLAQHAVIELRRAGLTPDFLMCRGDHPLSRDNKIKLSQFCSVEVERVVSVHNLSSLYHLPGLLFDQGVGKLVLEQLGFAGTHILKPDNDALTRWGKLAAQDDLSDDNVRVVKIALVGKYVGATDSYISVCHALQHAGSAAGVRVKISWIHSSHLEDSDVSCQKHDDAWAALRAADGVLIPGGFGVRGTEGLIKAIEYARVNKVPFFGICLGFQLAVVEFARHVLGWTSATSAEFATQEVSPPSTPPLTLETNTTTTAKPRHVIINMPEVSITHLGGTMRLGLRTSVLMPDTLASKIYGGATQIEERHRHRYEVNPEYVHAFIDGGLLFGGVDREEHVRMECLELEPTTAHPFFFGSQSHPEMLSGPFSPSAPFCAFVRAAVANVCL